MSRLRHYSIETDNTVLLQFVGGAEQRVPVGQLRKHLKGDDLRTVQGALNVRKTFFRRHLPKLALTIAAGGLIGVTALTQQAELDTLMHHSAKHPPVTHQPHLATQAPLLASPTPANEHVLGDMTKSSDEPSASPTSSNHGKSNILLPEQANARAEAVHIDIPSH